MIPVTLHHSVKSFLKTLPAKTRSKATRTLLLLEEYGHLLSLPHSKHVQGELFELRIRGYIQVRLLYGFANNQALIAHGFIKRSDKIPTKEIDLAYKRFAELAG